MALKYDTALYECAEGWYPLIDNALDQLYAISPNLSIAQIKEKFGGLRMYVYIEDGLTDDDYNRFHEIIRIAEDASYKICEDCGSRDAELRSSSHHWYRTTCAQHRLA